MKLIVLMMFLTGCQMGITNSCPPLVHYTEEEQKKLAETLKEIDKDIINKYIIDYGNLRNKIRRCHEF